VTDERSRVCSACGAPLAPRSRYCTRCGAVVPDDPGDEVLLRGVRRLRVADDTLSLPDLLALVEAGVAHWRKRLDQAEGVARVEAAAAIKELSRILESLAEQVAQGRETVRITRRLPAKRGYAAPCALCGRGNRTGAKYCIACGTPLRPGAKEAAHVPPPLSLDLAARTDIGMTRNANEDTIYTGAYSNADGPIGTLLIVADGMGGHTAGDRASQLAVTTIKHHLRVALEAGVPKDDAAWHVLLRRVAVEANQAVYIAARDVGARGMGTTLTVAVVTDRRVHLAHVGDSRAYLINTAGVISDGSTWNQLTTDHSLVARLVDIGQLTPEEARVHPQRNMIYRSLGTDPTVEVDAVSHALADGDVLVLCSDGLNNHVEDAEIAQIVLEELSEDRAAERLVALANQRGGKDNISVVIARARA
jgi:PPM family protein phosphatase